MANEPPFYAELDGKWHEVDAEGDDTVCGLALPLHAVWQRAVPDEVHCGAHKTRKPAAKPAKK